MAELLQQVSRGQAQLHTEIRQVTQEMRQVTQKVARLEQWLISLGHRLTALEDEPRRR
jgi:hypothetical protein